MGDKNFRKKALKAGMFLVVLSVLFFSGFAPVRAGFFDQAGFYFSEGGKTFGDAAGKLGSGAAQVWQNVGKSLGDAAGVMVKNTSQASDAFLSGFINFGQTIGGLGQQTAKGYDAALGKVKQGTGKATEKVKNVLPKKARVNVAAPTPAVENDSQKSNAPDSAAAQPATKEVENLPTAPAIVQKEENKKQSASVAPKEIIIYSNKANQESVQPLVASAAKAANVSNAVFETVKSKGNVLVGEDVVIDAATGIATLKGIKIIGTVDFTGADVKGFKQTVVNNYGGSTPLVVYNSSSGNYESRTSISGNYGGVSEHFSVGKDLTVSNAATIGAGGLTIGTATANGSLTVNGAATITGATTLSGAATLSSNLTVNGNTTLGDASGDTVTINGRLSTLNVSDGSTTSSLANNSFYLAADSSNALGKFYVDSSGNVSASGTLTTFGGVSLGSHLNPSSDNLYDVGASSTQWRYGNFQGGLLVADGSATSTLLNNSLTIGQSASYSSGVFYINSSGNTFASGTLQVTNTSTLYNDLLVGASTESIADAGFVFNGNDAYFHDKVGVNGIAYFDGAVQASSTLLIGTAAGTDNLFVNGNNTYIATSTAYGTAYSLVVGNGTTGAVVAGGHISPSHTNLFDLGRNGLSWANLYASSSIYTGLGGTSLTTLNPNGLAFAGSTGVVSSTAGNLRLAADGANQLQLWTNNNQRMFIDSSGNTFASGTLQVTNTSTLYNDLLVGASTESIADSGFIFNGNDFYVEDQLGVNGNAWFDGSIRASSTLLGTGNATFYGDITLGNASGDTITINGRLSTLNVSDGSTATSSLTNNSLTINQVIGTFDSGYFNVNSSGNTSVSGTLNLSNTTLAVVSSTAANLRLAADGANELQLWTNAVKRFYINSSGNIFASGTLQVTNTSTLYNDLLVGASTESIADSGFIFNGNDFYVEDQLGVNGNAWFDGSIRASSTLLATDAVTFYGNTTLGDAVGDTISLNGTVNTGILASSTLLIGTAAGTDNLFVSGNNTYVATSTAGGTAYSLIVGNGSTGAVLAGGHISPSHTGLFDIGRLGLAFNNVYASSSFNVGSGANSSTFKGNYLAMTDGTSSTVLNASSLTLGSGTNYNSGMFNVDSSGNISASSSLNLPNTASTSTIAGGLTVDGTTLVVDYSQGRVGIGSAPSGGALGATLHVKGSGASTKFENTLASGDFRFNLANDSNDSLLIAVAGSTYSGTYIGETGTGGTFLYSNNSPLTIGTADNNDFKIVVYGDNAARSITTFKNTGLVGVGTSTPYSKFSVWGTGTGTGQLFELTNSASTTLLKVLDNGTITVGNTVKPTSTSNIADLGALNTAFRDIFASSSVNVGASGTSSTFKGNYLAMTDGTSSTILNGSSLTLGSGTSYGSGMFKVDSNGNVSSSGTLRVFGNASTGGLQISATNSTTTFTSYSTDDVGSAGFVFTSTITSSSAAAGLNKVLFAVQQGSANKFMVSGGGHAYAAKAFNANYFGYGMSDVAEYVNLVDGESAEPGDVLVVDLSNPNRFKKSSSAYSKEIAGVISDTGAFIMGASGEDRAALALAGLVNTKVTDENGPINIGDYLVSASKPGYAMKYDSANPPAGGAGLVGMALEPLTEGEGKIAIMVNKGLVAGSNSAVSLTVGENSDGTLSGGENWDMGGKSILNVKSISGANGLWFIDEKGLLMAKEIKADKVQAKKFVVEKENDLKKASVGEATISQNNSSVTVENELITPKVKIFITFRSNPNSFWWISKQEDGKFEVSLSKETKDDLTFDYWIVGVEEAPALEPEAAASVPALDQTPAPAVVSIEPPVAPIITEPASVVPALVSPEVPPATEAVTESAVVSPSIPAIAVPVVEPTPEAVSSAAEPASAEPASVSGDEVSNP